MHRELAPIRHRLRSPPLVRPQKSARPRVTDDVGRSNLGRLLRWRVKIWRQIVPRRVRPFAVVVQPPLAENVFEVPLGHDDELVEALDFERLDDASGSCVRLPLTTLSKWTD